MDDDIKEVASKAAKERTGPSSKVPDSFLRNLGEESNEKDINELSEHREYATKHLEDL